MQGTPFNPNHPSFVSWRWGFYCFDVQESESEPEEDNVLTDISELSVQEVKLCLKEPLGKLQPVFLRLTAGCIDIVWLPLKKYGLNNRGYSFPARHELKFADA